MGSIRPAETTHKLPVYSPVWPSGKLTTGKTMPIPWDNMGVFNLHDLRGFYPWEHIVIIMMIFTI